MELMNNLIFYKIILVDLLYICSIEGLERKTLNNTLWRCDSIVEYTYREDTVKSPFHHNRLTGNWDRFIGYPGEIITVHDYNKMKRKRISIGLDGNIKVDNFKGNILADSLNYNDSILSATPIILFRKRNLNIYLTIDSIWGMMGYRIKKDSILNLYGNGRCKNYRGIKIFRTGNGLLLKEEESNFFGQYSTSYFFSPYNNKSNFESIKKNGLEIRCFRLSKMYGIDAHWTKIKISRRKNERAKKH